MRLKPRPDVAGLGELLSEPTGALVNLRRWKTKGHARSAACTSLTLKFPKKELELLQLFWLAHGFAKDV